MLLLALETVQAPRPHVPANRTSSVASYSRSLTIELGKPVSNSSQVLLVVLGLMSR